MAPMTNAEKQKAFRDRQKLKKAALEAQWLDLFDMIDRWATKNEEHEIFVDALRHRLEKLKAG